jgi:hypothetical protein
MRSILWRLLAAVTLLCGLVAAATPAGATGNPTPPTGDRLSLFDPPPDYPANTAFFVRHGWVPITASLQHGIGIYGFTLSVDGQDVKPTALQNGFAFTDDFGVNLRQLVLFNFPAGLPAGVHHFVGRWWGPCSDLILQGFDVGPCPTNPVARTLAEEADVDVTFD